MKPIDPAAAQFGNVRIFAVRGYEKQAPAKNDFANSQRGKLNWSRRETFTGRWRD
jgi:hypothetical protein